MIYCDVLVQSLSPAFAGGLTYACLRHRVKPGQLVSVPLRGRETHGVVIRVHRQRPAGTYVVRPIRTVLSNVPLIPSPTLETLRWISEHERCTLRQALSVMLPSKGKWSSLLPEALEQCVLAKRLACSSELLVADYESRKKEYLRISRDAVRKGRTVVLIVPFEKRAWEWVRYFGQQGVEATLWTSSLPAREKRMRFHQALGGETRVVVGTRSALFLPFLRLGTIIVDDEHDPLYKSDRTPRYHARDVARTLARKSGARLYLSSSSPSVESWWGVRCKAHTMRITGGGGKPHAFIIDVRESPCSPYPLTFPLLSHLEKVVRERKSMLVFLNDRKRLSEAEVLLKERFPGARMDFGTSSIFSLPMESAADVVVALDADAGSALPNFRTSEWTFQRLIALRNRARESLVIQTHRPAAPEVRSAATGDIALFLDGELEQRRVAGYPPFQSLVRLIVRGLGSEQRTSRLLALLKEEGVRASAVPPRQGSVWQILLRSSAPESVLSRLDLTGVGIDREPQEW